MKKVFLKTIIISILVAIIFVFIINIIEENNINKMSNQINCKHEFVITSKYDWLKSSYKTISKCIKCKLEV